MNGTKKTIVTVLHEKTKEWLGELVNYLPDRIRHDWNEISRRSGIIGREKIKVNDPEVLTIYLDEVWKWIDDELAGFLSPFSLTVREIYKESEGKSSWRETVLSQVEVWRKELKEFPSADWWKKSVSELSNQLISTLSDKFNVKAEDFINDVVVDVHVEGELLPAIEEYENSLMGYLEMVVNDLIKSPHTPEEEKEKIASLFSQFKENLSNIKQTHLTPLTDPKYWMKVTFGVMSDKRNPVWMVSEYKDRVLELVGDFLSAAVGVKFEGIPPSPEIIERKGESVVGRTVRGYEHVAEDIQQFTHKIDIYYRKVENYLSDEGVEFPQKEVERILENIHAILGSPPKGVTVGQYLHEVHGQLLQEEFSPEKISEFLLHRLEDELTKIDNEYLDEMERTIKEEKGEELRKEDKGEISPVAVWEKLVEGDDKMLKDISKFLAKLFFLFLHDWFNWEILGWLLALKLGFSPQQIQRYPELGWFAKAVTSYILIRSDDRNTRLLGRALLYHTEIPPEHVYVKVGGDFLPAVVDHYRRSAKHQPVLKELRKILELLAES